MDGCAHDDSRWFLGAATAADPGSWRPGSQADVSQFTLKLSEMYRSEIRATASSKGNKMPRDEKKRRRRAADAVLLRNLVGLCHLHLATLGHGDDHRVIAAATIGLPVKVVQHRPTRLSTATSRTT